MSKITIISSAIGLVILIAGALVGIDKWGHVNFATCEVVAQTQQQVQKTGERLEYKIDSDRRDKLQERNWALEAKFKTRDPLKMPDDVRTEYQKNQLEMMKVDDKWKGK